MYVWELINEKNGRQEETAKFQIAGQAINIVHPGSHLMFYKNCVYCVEQ